MHFSACKTVLVWGEDARPVPNLCRTKLSNRKGDAKQLERLQVCSFVCFVGGLNGWGSCSRVTSLKPLDVWQSQGSSLHSRPPLPKNKLWPVLKCWEKRLQLPTMPTWRLACRIIVALVGSEQHHLLPLIIPSTPTSPSPHPTCLSRPTSTHTLSSPQYSGLACYSFWSSCRTVQTCATSNCH